jgi:AcrR family transcriptional regulator
MDPLAQTRKEIRREQEFQRRRQEIMSAARTLFVEKGLRNTTLYEIADASAFGKGTIYNYFANKDDLFLAIIHQLIDESNTATEIAMKEAPEGIREKLLAYTQASLTHFHANNEVFLMVMREHHQLDPKSMEQFAERYREKLSMLVEPLETAMKAGKIANSDPQQLTVLFDGMIRTYCMAVTGGIWPTDGQLPENVAELMVSIFFDGIENKPNQE